MEVAAPLLLLVLLVAPLGYAALRAGSLTREDYLFNSGRTGLVATIAGVICGNIGVGTFLALFIFTSVSPVIGASLAGAYTLGLATCAALAPLIHRVSREHGAYGLVDLIAIRHNVSQPLLVWVPISFVFLLRSVVQLIALAEILASAFGLSVPAAIGLSTILIGAYTSIGGYRVATETDILQAGVILAGITLLAAASPGLPATPIDPFTLGPYAPALLVGIWLFIPASAVVAVDNWQRMATAASPAIARRAFMIATPICLTAYAVIVWIGLTGVQLDGIAATFRAMMPEGLGYVADLMLVAAIMSSIDTFVMPLMTTLARANYGIVGLRLIVAMVFAVMALLAIAIGGLLQSVIVAFNTLAVFLPAVFASLFWRQTNPAAAIVSLNLGVLAALAFTLVDVNTAALIGFCVSSVLYLGLHWRFSRPEAD